MSKGTLSIDGCAYDLDANQYLLVEQARSAFLAECDDIDAANGEDGHFHGFDSFCDPYRDARVRYEARIREIVGVS